MTCCSNKCVSDHLPRTKSVIDPCFCQKTDFTSTLRKALLKSSILQHLCQLRFARFFVRAWLFPLVGSTFPAETLPYWMITLSKRYLLVGPRVQPWLNQVGGWPATYICFKMSLLQKSSVFLPSQMDWDLPLALRSKQVCSRHGDPWWSRKDGRALQACRSQRAVLEHCKHFATCAYTPLCGLAESLMQGGLNPHLWYWMFLMALAETSRPGEEFRSSVLLLGSGGADWLLSWLFCTKGSGYVDHWKLLQLCSPCYPLPLPLPDCSVCQSRFPQSVFLLLFQYLKKRGKVASYATVIVVPPNMFSTEAPQVICPSLWRNLFTP